MNPPEKPTPNHLEGQGHAKGKTWLCVLLSFFILYHLAVIIIFPNGSSYLGRSLSSYLSFYANNLGLNANWNFFSPDPANTMFFQYHIYFENPQGDEIQPSKEGFIPAEKEQIVIDSSRRRLLYAMRFLFMDSHRMKMILGPWICRENPGASMVRINSIVEMIPNLDRAQIGIMEKLEESTVMKLTHRCGEAPEDEALL